MERKGPPVQKEVFYTDLGSGIYNISSPPVGFQQYLIVGEEKALLVDTGIGACPLKPTIEKITGLPVMVINTHGHPDHAGGNAEFAPALMNPADFPVFETMASREFRVQDVSHMPGGDKLAQRLQPTGPAPVPVENGAKINLGGRILTVIYAPGHTKGSLCVFEEATGVLFSGDNVQGRETALREDNSATIEEFYETLRNLRRLNPKIICGGHQPNINPPELLDKLICCAKEILDGAEDEQRPVRGGQMAFVHTYEDISISYRDNRYKPSIK